MEIYLRIDDSRGVSDPFAGGRIFAVFAGGQVGHLEVLGDEVIPAVLPEQPVRARVADQRVVSVSAEEAVAMRGVM